jgi:hypothetical protein
MGARASLVTLMLALTVEMYPAELAELQRLSDTERRARFDLPDTCTPVIGAVKRAIARSKRLIVLIDCKTADTPPSELLPIRWDQAPHSPS